MSILTATQREVLGEKFITGYASALKRLRIASDAQFRHTLYGMTLGMSSQAQYFGLINWDEQQRLDDLAMNAASYARREAP